MGDAAAGPSAAAGRGAAVVGDAVAGPHAAGASAAMRAPASSRNDAMNYDVEAPVGCTFRLNIPENRSPFFRGELPQGRLDSKGYHTKSAGWGFYSSRTEQEARDLVLGWLVEHGA